MAYVALVCGSTAAVLSLTLFVNRRLHDRRVGRIWRNLRESGTTARFREDLTSQLPEPARRFFRYAIQPETPIARSVELVMEGRIGLRPGAQKLPMHARQVISAQGFVWSAQVGRGLQSFSGEDLYFAGTGQMRWFLARYLPIIRAGGRAVTRSAAGRIALELPFMLPSALLPGNAVEWEEIDEASARVHVRVGNETASPLLTISARGELERVTMPRWDTNARDGKPGYVVWTARSLGGELESAGHRLPRRIEVTKRADTPNPDTFFEATIQRASFH